MARDVSQLHPRLQILITKLKEECKKQGLKIGIGECFRTVKEQDELYAQGRTKPGNIVTNAKGSSYSSMHQWGVAFDFYRNDGKGAYYDNDNFFTKVGKIGMKLGLEWGGNWKSIVDKPHFQLPDWGSTPTLLKQLYKTPDEFIKTWKRKDVTKPTKDWVLRLQKALNTNGYRDKDGNKLKEDGIAGEKTKSTCPSLKVGMKGDIVILAQERLWELGFDPKGINGSYGNNTGNAVIVMKKKVMGDKNPTNILGNQSWNVLLGLYKK